MTVPAPTERELQILKIIWQLREATVREVYEQMRELLSRDRDGTIAQNTVQAFLRTMEEKGLVEHRSEGRTFIYRATIAPDPTKRTLLSGVLDRVFDGAIDQLVESALALKRPTPEELRKLRELVDEADGGKR